MTATRSWREALTDLGSSEQGLDEEDALFRLASIGPNEPVLVKRRTVTRQILRRFASPLVLILVGASVVSAAFGNLVNAAVVWVMVAGSIALEFVQTRRSERTIESLEKGVAPTATVVRAGRAREIARRELVPGDVVRLSAGDLVPADLVLMSARDLHVNEAALTGESLPVEKSVAGGAEARGLADPTRVFLGSSIVSGTATALVTETGPDTAFADVARALAQNPPRTEFENGVNRFGIFILKTVLLLVLVVFAVTALQRRDPLDALLFAVALAVGLTPEFLPMITTVTLARGAARMAKERVVVKNLAAIQNLGSIDILCSDKTGTLTTGHMTLDVHIDPFGGESERPLLFASVNSYFESGVENPIDAALLRKSRIDPLDAAVLEHPHPDIAGYRKVDEIPFDFERRRVSIVVERDGERLLVTKGAPEQVTALCTHVEIGGEVLPLDGAAMERVRATHGTLGARGLRVLAVAKKSLPSKNSFSKDDERDLTLSGFLGFLDPPREDVGRVLHALAVAGVKVKIVTGDSNVVTRSVCERVGIHAPVVLLGSDVEKMSDPALGSQAEKTDVFARVSPAQKSRILAALRARGHVVGFLGDGINDAPSLRAADVGISVAGATDVAKDAASIILLEQDLGVLLAGVVEGRKAFGNVMKYLLMGTSSNFGNVFSMAIAAAFLPFLPMLPAQILLNNFLYDLAQVTIPSDRVDPAFADKPRRWDIDVLRKFMLFIGPLSSFYDFVTFFVLRRVFHASEAEFHTGWFVESLATQTLVIFVIRTMKSPFQNRPSTALLATAFAVVGFGVALPFTPLAGVFGFVPLPAAFFAFLVGATLTYLVLVQWVKRTVLRRLFG